MRNVIDGKIYLAMTRDQHLAVIVLGVGTTSPSFELHLSSNVGFFTQFYVRRLNFGLHHGGVHLPCIKTEIRLLSHVVLAHGNDLRAPSSTDTCSQKSG